MPPKPRTNRAGDLTRLNSKIPLNISQILASVLKRNGLEEKIARYQFVLKWEEIVGKEIARKTKPDSIRNGKLFVRVSDSAWANELSFHKSAMIKRLRSYFPQSEEITDIQFVVGDLT